MSKKRQDTDAQFLHVLVAARLYAPEELPGPVAVVMEGTTIHSILRGMDAATVRNYLSEHMPGARVEVTDLGDWSVAPGYIDLHTHGFCGYDVATGSQEDIEAMAGALPRTGVTSFFPTIATLEPLETVQQVQRGVDAARGQSEACSSEIVGLRLEGPFINRAKKGAQYEPGIRLPDSLELEKLVEVGQGWIRIIDYAPEHDENSSFVATAVRLGLLACIGHTAATYEQTLHAIDGGARHSTHLFNAMSAFDHREPAVAGALLTDSRVTVEVIADGIHLHPAAIQLAIAARGVNNIALITDAVGPAGLPEGEYSFVGRKVTLCAGAVRLANGSLAGSILTLDRAVRNIVSFTGLGWPSAISMATVVPARIAGIASRKGSISPGMDADLLALDEQGLVQQTWIGGQLAYSLADQEQ